MEGNGVDLARKRLYIQQQLILLLHAIECQKRESTYRANGGDSWTCPVLLCQLMKNIIKHLSTCTAGRSCSAAHCLTSRMLLSHWKNCVKQNCPVCRPARERRARAA